MNPGLVNLIVKLCGFLFSFILISLFLGLPLWDVIIGFVVGGIFLTVRR